MAIELTLTTNDPQIRKNTEQLFVLLEREDASKAKMLALIKAGVDIKATNDEDFTALHVAAICGHTKVVRLLLDFGADIEATDFKGNTALHLAAAHGCGAAVRVLLDRGADLDVRNETGSTALHLTIDTGTDAVTRYVPVFDYIEPAQLLLTRGANVLGKDSNRRDVLDWAGMIDEGGAARSIINYNALWQPRYEKFLKNKFEPKTQAEWLGLASVMKLSDPKAYSGVADRVAQLMDWHKGLKSLRAKAASPAIGELGV